MTNNNTDFLKKKKKCFDIKWLHIGSPLFLISSIIDMYKAKNDLKDLQKVLLQSFDDKGNVFVLLTITGAQFKITEV